MLSQVYLSESYINGFLLSFRGGVHFPVFRSPFPMIGAFIYLPYLGYNIWVPVALKLWFSRAWKSTAPPPSLLVYGPRMI